MSFKKIKKGLSLIEIIVSVAILGIICVSFVTAFTSGFVGVTLAGHRSRAQYDTQTKIEQDIDNGNIVKGTDDLSIDFDSGLTVNVQGKIKTQSSNFNGKQVLITFFVPNI